MVRTSGRSRGRRAKPLCQIQVRRTTGHVDADIEKLGEGDRRRERGDEDLREEHGGRWRSRRTVGSGRAQTRPLRWTLLIK